MSVPVGMAWAREGLYVSSHGKVSLLRDTDGDGIADVEEVVASGWPPTDVASGGVDATAVTTDHDGNLYFGLLTADYSNPYRVKDGQSHYDLDGQREDLKWWRLTGRLETIATGIRVPYTLAFNRAGDLFVTDQEGETWCPGGNPLDELNHIIPGRNYGFPPRHEKYLPSLISEPPVVAFGPQHQSSCGLAFNEASEDRKSFGPLWWEGDAIVAGESRGKLWRVRLVKTPAGYVGRETIIARLNMLTLDVAISAAGDLYVCCHSGLPDWGNGPTGQGKIFKISYTDGKAPQPVAAWASGPMEVKVAFDAPIDPAVTNQIERMKLEFGEYVSAADRLEALKPPYQAVARQEVTPRGKLRVVFARLSSDNRTLILTTDPHPQSARYAVQIPGVRAAGSTHPAAEIDLSYNLNGVEAAWFEPNGPRAATWTGWVPHIDWMVNRAFLANSAGHERLLSLIGRPGRLELHTQLILPNGKNRLRLEGAEPFEAIIGSNPVKARPSADQKYAAEIPVDSNGEPQSLALKLNTQAGRDVELHADYSSESDPTRRPLPLDALFVPWAPPRVPPPAVEAHNSELVGGDFEGGRDLFFGERLKCATCHRLRGEGATVGPDLSNLVHKDAASVRRDIATPNATINPDYVAYNVTLRDGDTINGFVRAQTRDLLRVTMVDGKERVIPRADITDLHPSAVSLMPSGLLDGLTEGQVRDLLTFLLHQAPVHSGAEIEALRRQPMREAAAPQPRSSEGLNVVLVAGKQDHGSGQHDYPAWQKTWSHLLNQKPGVHVTEAWEWPTEAQWESADLIVFYLWNHDWNADRLHQMDAFLDRGGGLAMLHAATIADTDPQSLAERIGLAAQPGPTKYLHTPLVLQFSASPKDVISNGFTKLDLLDEPYWPMIGDTNRIVVLATASLEGSARPLIWTFERGKGRVFASIPGHYTWTLDDPLFRALVLRGLAWASGRPTNRLE